MCFSGSMFSVVKLFVILLMGGMVALISCGPVPDDGALPTALGVGSSSGYPAAEGYQATEGMEGYPVPSAEIILQEPPPILPSFPGKIAFQTERFSGSLQVAIFDGATGEISQLNPSFSQSFEPTWSSDCGRLIYTVGQSGGADFALYQQSLTSTEASLFINHDDYYDWGAEWSALSGVVAYQTNENALINVCFADGAGNELGCMERAGYSNAMPAWSPDGSQLVFSSNRDGNWELFLVDYPALSTVTKLTENGGINYDPDFSPDGNAILFSSQRGSDFNIFSIQGTGEDEVQLTNDGGDERFPVWVGESLIAYAGGFQDEMELYLMNVDGTNVQQLTYSSGKDEWPSWCAAP